MIKITAIIASIAAAALISVSAAAITPEEAIPGKVLCNDEAITYASEILSNKKLSEVLEIPEDWAVIVNSGKKLVLNKGCVVKGTVYVEDGGYLAVSGGTLDIQGSVVCDGTVSVGKKAAVAVRENGEFYISKSGLFKSKTGRIGLDDNCSVACLGKTSMSGCDKDIKDTLNAKPIFALNVRKNPYTGGFIDCEQVTPEKAIETISGGYYLNKENPAGGYSEMLTMVFSNGSTVNFLQRSGKIYKIGSARMSILARITSENDYREDDYSGAIVNGAKYHWDMNIGYDYFSMDNGRMTFVEPTSFKELLTKLDSYEYLGRFTGKGNDELCNSGADMYLMPDNRIIMVWRFNDSCIKPSTEYKELSDLSKVYLCAVYVPDK